MEISSVTFLIYTFSKAKCTDSVAFSAQTMNKSLVLSLLLFIVCATAQRDWSAVEKVLTDGIADQAFPGCVALVADRSGVVWSKGVSARRAYIERAVCFPAVWALHLWNSAAVQRWSGVFVSFFTRTPKLITNTLRRCRQ